MARCAGSSPRADIAISAGGDARLVARHGSDLTPPIPAFAEAACGQHPARIGRIFCVSFHIERLRDAHFIAFNRVEVLMSVTVRIPTALRKLSEGNESVELEGATVGAVIDAIRTSYPQLAEQLVDDQGKVRRFVNLFANDEDIRFLDDLDTTLAPGDELSIVPAIAGGR